MHMGTTSTNPSVALEFAVHPHAHGDNFNACSTERKAYGSPPCTWGQRLPAGSRTTTSGSPPCTWGQLRPAVRGDNARRFTPMHMGTTSANTPEQLSVTVHPHAHGDNASPFRRRSCLHGSPPCTWGQRELQQGSILRGRFTPMHMGTTSSPTSFRRMLPVHPHAHGDNSLRAISPPPPNRFTPMHMGTTPAGQATITRQCGSPPCTWGQRPRRACWSPPAPVHPHAHGDNSASDPGWPAVRRFTPMHMGTTSSRLAARRVPCGSPHAHGDNVYIKTDTGHCIGSPPCTWGQPELVAGIGISLRFTPMHMGTTSSHTFVTNSPSVHPHAHGDNWYTRKDGRKVAGSPPCTWGQHYS